MTHPDADAIVVGSGFGGAVAAARLAQAGFSVIVLERGRRWRPGDFPRAARLDDGWLWNVDQGLYDVRWLGGMLAAQAAGWGGGSLAYANVFTRPFDGALPGRWPGHLRRRELDPYYDLAAHMLGVAPAGDDPGTGAPPARTALVEDLMGASDRPGATTRPKLAVTFGDPDTWRTNRYGAAQRGCAFVGECVIGCNHGAKNSLDLTYLAAAEIAGARAVTDAKVTRIEPREGGYAISTTTPSDPSAAPRVWTAPRVVLAAGAVATTELLLRARDVHRTLPRLSARLGHGFSGNGDFLSLAELRTPRGDMTTGPTITTNTVLDVPEGRRSVWFQVQDGAFPLALHELFDAVVPGQRVRRWWRARTGPPPLRSVFAVLAMGHDSGNGRLRLNRSGTVRLAWRNQWQANLYRSQQRVGPMLARLLDARPYHPPTWSILRRTTTVHPLGGVRPGPDAATGVVDTAGEVHGYPGLFVMDGSVLPASTGVNPSATILAVAECSVEALIARAGRPGWRAPEWAEIESSPSPEDAAFTFAADLHAGTRGGGITFRERMVSAARSPHPVVLALTAELPSIDNVLTDPAHEIPVHGTVDVEGIATRAAATGTLSLFPEDRDEAMVYTVHLTDDTGRRWRLTGAKTTRSRTPRQLLRSLTRLDGVLTSTDTTAQIPFTVTITPREVIRLLASIRGRGFTAARRALTTVRFASFFVRSALRARPVAGP